MRGHAISTVTSGPAGATPWPSPEPWRSADRRSARRGAKSAASACADPSSRFATARPSRSARGASRHAVPVQHHDGALGSWRLPGDGRRDPAFSPTQSTCRRIIVAVFRLSVRSPAEQAPVVGRSRRAPVVAGVGTSQVGRRSVTEGVLHRLTHRPSATTLRKDGQDAPISRTALHVATVRWSAVVNIAPSLPSRRWRPGLLLGEEEGAALGDTCRLLHVVRHDDDRRLVDESAMVSSITRVEVGSRAEQGSSMSRTPAARRRRAIARRCCCDPGRRFRHRGVDRSLTSRHSPARVSDSSTSTSFAALDAFTPVGFGRRARFAELVAGKRWASRGPCRCRDGPRSPGGTVVHVLTGDLDLAGHRRRGRELVHPVEDPQEGRLPRPTTRSARSPACGHRHETRSRTWWLPNHAGPSRRAGAAARPADGRRWGPARGLGRKPDRRAPRLTASCSTVPLQEQEERGRGPWSRRAGPLRRGLDEAGEPQQPRPRTRSCSGGIRHASPPRRAR